MTSGERAGKPLVFIRHAGDDSGLAEKIAEAVCAAGADTFLDVNDIDVGAEFEKVIRAKLNEASELLVLFTPWSVQRAYVWAEIGVAWGRSIPIITLVYGLSVKELMKRPEVPLFIKEREIMSLNDVDAYLKQLSKRQEVGRNHG